MLSHLKKRLGVLTAIAVMAALVPVLAASPAGAAVSTTTQAKADTTKYKACPASASATTGTAGFTDVTSSDVDCIAYYGITTGVTATTYEPSSTVTRETMALFLTRMATTMGVTLGSGADQDFTDLPDSAASVTAINQIKQLGVTVGKTATTYAPDDNVTREEMAMFIERLLAKTAPGPNGNSDDTTTTNISGNATTYNYADIDTGVTYEGHNSIVELYHLGVTDDVAGAAAYRPSEDITRLEMATMMNNALAHSNAAPAGLHVQATHNAIVGAAAGTQELMVTHRAAKGSTGVEGTLVDLIAYTTVTTLDSVAFAATGVCSSAVNGYGGATACKIDVSDNVTSSTGNFEVALNGLAVTVAEAGTVQYWAWTDATGTTYVDGTATASTTTVSSTAGGDFARWTISSHPHALESSLENVSGTTEDTTQGFQGSDITIQVQLQSANGISALSKVAQAGCSIGVNVASGAFGGASTTISNSIITTDATGLATYTAAGTATVAAGADNDVGGHQIITFSNSATANVAAGCTAIGTFVTGALGTDTDTRVSIQWDDVPRAKEKSVSTVANAYVAASALTAGASNTVTTTVYDQYGVGMAGESVGLVSSIDLATVSTFTVTRTTNASGVATFGVNRVAGTTGKETFTANTTSTDWDYSSVSAYWTATADGTVLDTGLATSAPNAFTAGTSDSHDGTAANGQPTGAFVVSDRANDKLVAHLCGDDIGCKYMTYTYDSNDSFMVGGVAKTMAQWEVALATPTQSAAGVFSASDDLGVAGYLRPTTASYSSGWSWAG